MQKCYHNIYMCYLYMGISLCVVANKFHSKIIVEELKNRILTSIFTLSLQWNLIATYFPVYCTVISREITNSCAVRFFLNVYKFLAFILQKGTKLWLKIENYKLELDSNITHWSIFSLSTEAACNSQHYRLSIFERKSANIVYAANFYLC